MKKIVIILGILVTVLVGALLAIPYFFKGRIVEEVKKVINQELVAEVNFNNDIGLSLIRNFPNISLSVDDIVVSGKEDFKGDTLLNMKSFRATLDLMSVITGDEIRIKRILLDEPNIHLKVLENGKANWDITRPSEDTSSGVEDTSSSAFKIALKNYEVRNANIIYDDRQSDLYTELKNFSHQGKGDFTQDNFLLETNSTADEISFITGGIPYLNKVKTAFVCNLDMDMPHMKFTFRENNLKLNALEMGLDGYVSMPDDHIGMDLAFQSKKTDFKELLSLIPAVYTKDYDKVQTAGKMALEAKAKGVLNTDLDQYPAFDVKLLIEKAMFRYPDLPEALNNINMDLQVSKEEGSLNSMLVNMKQLHFELGKEPFDLTLFLKQPMTDPHLDLSAKGKIVLDHVKQLIPLDKGTDIGGTIAADVQAKGHVSTFTSDNYEAMNASGTLEATGVKYVSPDLPAPFSLSSMKLIFNPKEVQMPEFVSKFGHSDLSLNGSVSNFFGYLFKEGEVLKGNLNVKSELMDANMFLSEGGEEQKETPAPADTMALEAIAIPANVDLGLKVNIKKLLYDNLVMEAIDGGIEVRNQEAILNGLAMNVFDGNVKMNGKYDSKNLSNPAADVNMELKEIDIRKSFDYMNTLQQLAPIAKYLTGKVSASFNLKTLLDKNMSPVLSSISSLGTLKTSQAVLSGFTPMLTLADKLKLDKFKEVVLTNMSLMFEVVDGRVKLKKPLEYKLEDIGITVEEEGYTTFDQLLNYKMKLNIPSSAFGEKGRQALDGLLKEVGKTGVNLKPAEKILVNVLVGGSISKPVITTSMKEITSNVADVVKDEVTRVVEEKKEEAKQKINAEAQKLIDDAAKKGDQLIAKAREEGDRLRTTAKTESDRLVAEADKKAQQLIKDAGSNPVKKLAAEKAGDKLKKEAREAADKTNAEADRKANDLVKKAEEEKKRLITEAESKKLK